MKKKVKPCLYCKQEFVFKRRTAQFCSSTCRSQYWQEQKGLGSEIKPIGSNLKGVIKEDVQMIPATPEKKFIEQKIPNPEFQECTRQIVIKENEIKQCQQELQKLQEEYKDQTQGGGVWSALGALAGGIAGHYLTDHESRNSGKHISNIIACATGGAGVGVIADIASIGRKKEKAQHLFPVFNAKTEDLTAKIALLEAEKESLIILRSIFSPHTVVKKEVIENQSVSNEFILPASPSQMNNKRLDNDNRSLKPIAHTIPGIELGERIMKSKDFLEHKYDTLNFQGKWGEFFGNPSVNFRCAISGMAGNGKTTFAIQFAKYLATNHGSVVYISSEEGFSKTLKDKITIEGSASDNLFIADLKTAEEIKATIKPEMFNFIFLDSLDNMHIDANELNKLRQFYINSALITISQSTKDGKMRGSYQIVHDSDIEIEVLNLEAVTKKNRFNEKNIKLSVIQKADVSFQGPRNTISK